MGEPTARQWYIFQNNQKYGPYSEEQMHSFISESRLKGNSLVWCQGMGSWAQAGNVEPFKSHFARPVAPARPAPPAGSPISVGRRGGRKVAAVAALIVIAIVVGIGIWWIYPQLSGRSSASQPQQPSAMPPSVERTATVNSVHDGDTIYLSGGETVRLVCVDSEEIQLTGNNHAISLHPELEGMTEAQYQQTEYYQKALAAKNYVSQLCQGKQIGLDVDNINPQDPYDRTLAIVWANENGNWINLNRELYRKGYASLYPYYSGEFESELSSW